MSRTTPPTWLRTGCQPRHEAQAAQEQQGRGNQVEPEGAHEQEEPQVPPAVAKAAQMRWPVPAIGRQGRRYFADFLFAQARLDHHLAGELHAGRREIQTLVGVLAEATQATMRILDRRAEKEVQDAGKDRVADVAVHPRHGSGQNASLEAIAHHQLVAPAQLLDKGRQPREVVGIVGVAHDDVLAQGGRDPSLQSATVTLALDVDHARPLVAGQLLRTVGAAIVGHDDLTADAHAVEARARLGDAVPYR